MAITKTVKTEHLKSKPKKTDGTQNNETEQNKFGLEYHDIDHSVSENKTSLVTSVACRTTYNNDQMGLKTAINVAVEDLKRNSRVNKVFTKMF